MGQQEIMNYLKEVGEATTMEISRGINIGRPTVNRCLFQMTKYKEVTVRLVKKNRNFAYVYSLI